VTGQAGVGGFPGAVGISLLRVYDSTGPDGVPGGSPHLHTASTEGYQVLSGRGAVQTLSGVGYAETALEPGTLLWFTPGTVHRLVNLSGDLRILVIMQNAGLPEAGDAVLTFPEAVLADPARYAAAAAQPADDAAARRRRDLAVEGFTVLRERVCATGPVALQPLYAAAAHLVRDRVPAWRQLWRDRALAQAEHTGRQLTGLAGGDAGHLTDAAVHVARINDAERFGMCGRLTLSTGDPIRVSRTDPPSRSDSQGDFR
jgi:mannose-6-phosphate isomerase-like protein (cupin superfamily)